MIHVKKTYTVYTVEEAIAAGKAKVYPMDDSSLYIGTEEKCYDCGRPKKEHVILRSLENFGPDEYVAHPGFFLVFDGDSLVEYTWDWEEDYVRDDIV